MPTARVWIRAKSARLAKVSWIERLMTAKRVYCKLSYGKLEAEHLPAIPFVVEGQE